MHRVRAQLEGIDGEVSAPARFETLAALPGPPRSLRLVARADRTVTLEWSAPAEQCGPLAPLRAYALEYAELRERRPASAASSASAASVCLLHTHTHILIIRLFACAIASGAESLHLVRSQFISDYHRSSD